MASVITKCEAARGCGFRKPGGMYLVSEGIAATCFKLPIPLTYCPCCGAGIKFSRSFQWITKTIVEKSPCSKKGCTGCVPFDGSIEKFGLMWVGDKFYSPKSYSREAAVRGVSKRIPFIPKELEIGETWMLLAHKKAIFDPDDKEMKPGIFYAFMPTAVEYVIKGDETEEDLNHLEARGITLVNVVYDGTAETAEIEF